MIFNIRKKYMQIINRWIDRNKQILEQVNCFIVGHKNNLDKVTVLYLN